MILKSIGITIVYLLKICVLTHLLLISTTPTNNLLHLHGISPVSLAFVHEQQEILVVLSSLGWGHVTLGVGLAALGEFQGFSHAVDLPHAVFVVSAIVIMSKTILVL